MNASSRLREQLLYLDKLERTAGANDQLRRGLLRVARQVRPSLRAWVYARRILIFAGTTSLLTGLLYGLVKARNPKLNDLGKLDFMANRHWLLGTPVLILTALVIFLAAQVVNNYIWLSSVRVKRQLEAQLPERSLNAMPPVAGHSGVVFDGVGHFVTFGGATTQAGAPTTRRELYL